MVQYLRAANVKDGVLVLDDVQRMNFTPAEQRIFALQPGDVLVTEGCGSLQQIGASAVWQSEIEGTVCFQNTLLRLRPRAGLTDGRFLGWWARAAFASGLFASVATGANIYHLSAERVRALPINLPPLDEQRRIAEFLDGETARISRLSQLQQAVLAKLEERDSAFLDLEIDRLSAKFGNVPFRRFILGIEQGFSPQCDAVPADEGEWGVLKVSSVRPGEFFAEENKRLPDDVSPVRRYEVRGGDLLITRANTPQLVGAAAVVPSVRPRLLLCDKIFRIRVAQHLDKNYLACVARGSRIRALCASASHGTSQSMANLKAEEIKGWPIPAAPLAEQRNLCEAVRSSRAEVEKLRIAIKRQLELLAERRQALITAAVTGQIDVTTARAISA